MWGRNYYYNSIKNIYKYYERQNFKYGSHTDTSKHHRFYNLGETQASLSLYCVDQEW